MPDSGDNQQVPAALIDISNNDMPTMHVPSRDSMFRPDLSSNIEDEEVSLEYYEEDEDIEKEASGLLSPYMSLPYEFNQIGDDFGIQNDEVSYAEEDLKTPASTPDVNHPRDMLYDEEEDVEDEDSGDAYYDKKNNAWLYADIIKTSSDQIRRYSLNPDEVDINDSSSGYSLWHYDGVEWRKHRSFSGRELYDESGKFNDEYNILFTGNWAVLSSEFVPNECNAIPRHFEWFMFEGPSWPTVPYFHKVNSGDSISCLSDSYFGPGSSEELIDINKHVYGDGWDPNKIEVGDLIYLIPKEWAKKLHENNKSALFEFVCGNEITPDRSGGWYWEACDPNHEHFLGDLGANAYTEYCKNSDNPVIYDDTIDKDGDNYNQLCDPSSEWYVGRKAGEKQVDEDGTIAISPGEKVEPGESDFRSSHQWSLIQDEMLKERLDEQRALQEQEDEARRKQEEEAKLRRAEIISGLEPHPLTRNWLHIEGQTNEILFNNDWIRYLSYIGIDDDDIEQIYSHEVLIYEGRTINERRSAGISDESFGEVGYTGRKPLATIYPLCYEPVSIETDIVIPISNDEPIRIKKGHYSLRKCIPEENGRRVWDPISKRLVAYQLVSNQDMIFSEWNDPRNLPGNDIFDQAEGVRRASGKITLRSYSTFSSGYDDISIITSQGSVVNSDYHRARNRLLEMAGVDNLKLILSAGVPEDLRCFKGGFNQNEDPCFTGWCMPDAMMKFTESNFAGFDRYALNYNPYDVDEVSYRTGWELDTTPWPTEWSGPVDIASTFMMQKMSDSESAGHWLSPIIPFVDPVKDVPFEEWPNISSRGKSVVEFSMPIRIIRKNSRDGSLNREQRLLKTLIDLYEESSAIRKDSVFSYGIYFVLPGEAFNPFQGECNFIKKYYDEYLKLAGGGTANSMLHDFRPKRSSGEVDSTGIEILDSSMQRSRINFAHSGPRFSFAQVEEFYLKWKSSYF